MTCSSLTGHYTKPGSLAATFRRTSTRYCMQTRYGNSKPRWQSAKFA
ncbi:hypothetical protein [Nostoc sp. DSM 114160]